MDTIEEYYELLMLYRSKGERDELNFEPSELRKSSLVPDYSVLDEDEEESQ